MKFKIHHQSGDYLVVDGETVEECRNKMHTELKKRNWHTDDCWSEEIE